VLLFCTFALTTVVLAFGGALLFSLFWTGAALTMVLVPSLVVCVCAAACMWCWAVGAYLAARQIGAMMGYDVPAMMSQMLNSMMAGSANPNGNRGMPNGSSPMVNGMKTKRINGKRSNGGTVKMESDDGSVEPL
jgi:hypothetical protein